MVTNILDTTSKQEIGQRLKQARKRRGITQAEAAGIIDVGRTTVTAIEKGERQITEGELIRLAHAYGHQVSDFVRPRPQGEPFAVQFRSVYRTQADDKIIEDYVDQFDELCRDYLELEDIVQIPLVYKFPAEVKVGQLAVEREAEITAQEQRDRFGLGDGPVPSLRSQLEQNVGLRIFYIEMEPSSKYSAMYTYNSELGGCIAINRKHPEERRRFSLAHEYAHFLAHRYASEVLAQDGYQRQPKSERFANLFAQFFLMPTSGVTRRFKDMRQSHDKVTPADLCTLAHHFGVSVEAMSRRLEDLRLLPAGTWDRLHRSGFRIRDAQKALNLSPITENAELLPRRYKYLATYAYDQGMITEGQLARFLRVNRIQAREVAASLREISYDVFEHQTDLK